MPLNCRSYSPNEMERSRIVSM